jgi:hypothetical protein
MADSGTVDPRKIGYGTDANGQFIIIGCNACGGHWKVPCDGKQGKARLKHQGRPGQSYGGVPKCKMIDEGYECTEGKNAVCLATSSPKPTLPLDALPMSFRRG